MEVLSRKLGQRIKIGDNITVIIVGIEFGKVKLGIEAPREITITRSELLSNPPPPALPSDPEESSTR